MIADIENKDEARRLVPPAFRADARIIGLNKFTLEDLDRIMSRHEIRERKEYIGPSLGGASLVRGDRDGLQRSEVRLQK
jgi:hypothetical protein